MNIIPTDILTKYRTLEEIQDPDLTAFIAGAFSNLSRLSHEAAYVSDPVAGKFFMWQHPEHPDKVLEVVGQLDDKLSMVLYRRHWIFNTKQAHLEAREELVRAFLKVRGADLSRVEGLLMMHRGKGRPVWTGELLTVEMLVLLAKTMGQTHLVPAAAVRGASKPPAPQPDPEIAAELQAEADMEHAAQVGKVGFVTKKDLEAL
jgi:hypothetical protein